MSRRHALVVVAVLFQVGSVGLFGACADPEKKPAPAVPGMANGSSGGGGGGGAEGGVVDEGGFDSGEGGVCNDLVNGGVLVDRTAVNGDPPTATGGTVVDGTYNLTDYSVYVGTGGAPGPTGITAKATLRIAAGKIDEILELGGTGKTSTVTTTSSVYSVTGATFAETDLCPTGGGGRQLQFSANDPQLILTDPTTKEAFTFAKQ